MQTVGSARRGRPHISLVGVGIAARGARVDIPPMNSEHAVPFVDLAREHAELREELEAALLGVARSGGFILGPAVERFEEEVARCLGVGSAVGVASGSDALQLSLRALGVGAGDEVITSPFTFVAAAGAVVHAGATPVFADIQPDSFNLSAAAVEAAITPRTAALLPVHLFGQMADLASLEEIAERHGLALVEDAAQAFGASQAWSGEPSRTAESATHVRLAGATGAAGCFSFYPTKNLGGLGDGGLVATNDRELAERIRRLRGHGLVASTRGSRQALGWNSRLDALQAAVLRVKLPHVESWNERRRAHAAAYDAALGEIPAITPPPVVGGNRHVYHQYTVRCGDRRWVRSRLDAARIGYGIYYATPLHREAAFASLGYREGDYPEAERAAREVLSLPVFAGLRKAERERVIGVLREASEAPDSLDRQDPLD